MKSLLKIQQKLIPQVMELMERRYCILRQISLSEPIGRRTLSNVLGISERVVRSETEFLKEQNLIDVAVSGMTITQEGIKLLDELKDMMNDIMGLSTLQEKVREKLGIKKVLLVPGSYDNNPSLIKDVAKCGAEYFLSILKDGDVVSITGGSTMFEFSNTIKTDKKYENVTVVPARGSMGKDVEIQSNNVVATTSKKLNSHYKLLHIPDELGEESMKTLTQEPQIKNTLDMIAKTDILVFGIGIAGEMAIRRKLPIEKVEEIVEKGAIGEAFGHYFNEKGEIVCKLNTVGIHLETFKNVRESIAIFAGTRKADALIAMTNINKNMVLITDEESANRILEL
ncbi:sugar-binding domain-containing protein [Romboutsia sedimentorum]|uniref:sugar-binding transcriptional regulator n=1 Tax=Romboutsia sedimentorum TaxID=1368474 RepID=UPI0024DE38D2|nr:sugar-binding domain-containing protein [Romboutsia sedimentorum]MDK2586019.1 sugar-binding domain-containing protein [Romboutsia sedimentorum]